MLPACGSDMALAGLIRDGRTEILQEMYAEWPFFQVYIDMLEMVLAKSDLTLPHITSVLEKNTSWTIDSLASCISDGISDRQSDRRRTAIMVIGCSSSVYGALRICAATVSP